MDFRTVEEAKITILAIRNPQNLVLESVRVKFSLKLENSNNGLDRTDVYYTMKRSPDTNQFRCSMVAPGSSGTQAPPVLLMYLTSI